LLRLLHSGFTDDPVWDKAVAEAESSWSLAVDNLESVLTTGIDKRQASRPILGIMPEELTADVASKAGIAVGSGVYVAGVFEEAGAAESGIQKGDVITGIGGISVSDPDSLATTLANFHAGERVHLSYMRGKGRFTVAVALKPAPMPKVDFDPQQLVARVQPQQAALLQRVREALARVSEDQTRTTPAAGEWSVMDILAHLSLSERFAQSRFADTIAGTTAGQPGGNRSALPELLAMTLDSAPTAEALLARWENDMRETLTLFAALRPEVVANKARYYSMASNLLLDFHAREHVNQIEATVEALRV
jgi:hypothetical protein